MNPRKLSRRSYQPHSPEATARRRAAGQYNWAIHQIKAGLSTDSPAKAIAQKTNNQALIEECLNTEQAQRAVLDILHDPTTRKAWMAQVAPKMRQ